MTERLIAFIPLDKKGQLSKMINDDFECDIAASMDDLESVEYLSAQSAKQSKLPKPSLPEIDENSTYVSHPSTGSMSSTSSESFRLTDSMITNLRKTVLINNATNESIAVLSDRDNDNRDKSDNDKSSANKVTNTDDGKNGDCSDNGNAKNTQITGTHRKFIVTRMDSNAILRPEAENLRNLTEKSNAATIHFPCSSGVSHKKPLAGVFASNASFEPHLDRRFFDSSMVEVRIKNSTQSLNSTPEKVDRNIWERRRVDTSSVSIL